MNLIKCVTVLPLIFTSLIVTSFAYAAPHEKGTYVEWNIGASSYARIKYTPEFNYSEPTSIGSNVNLGHLFNRYFATEIGYTKYNLRGNAPNSVDLAVKFIYPFDLVNYDLNVFAKIGSAYLFDTGLRPLVGIGAAYQVTPKLDLNTQIQDSLCIDGKSSTLLSVGLTYHF